MDKTADKMKHRKGKAYCDTPGTSCCYTSKGVCVNCERPKGWRVSRLNHSRLDRLRGL